MNVKSKLKIAGLAIGVTTLITVGISYFISNNDYTEKKLVGHRYEGKKTDEPSPDGLYYINANVYTVCATYDGEYFVTNAKEKIKCEDENINKGDMYIITYSDAGTEDDSDDSIISFDKKLIGK